MYDIIIHNLKMDSIDIISVKNSWKHTITTYGSSQGNNDKRL